MKVRCIYESLNELPEDLAAKVLNRAVLESVGQDTPAITKGKEYIVLGICCCSGNMEFDIINDMHESFSVSVLAVFFEVIDSIFPSCWRIEIASQGDFRIWPRSWISDPYYHDRLSEGESEIVSDFKQVCASIIQESGGV